MLLKLIKVCELMGHPSWHFLTQLLSAFQYCTYPPFTYFYYL